MLEIRHFASIACFLNAFNDRVQTVEIFILGLFPRGGHIFNDISCDCTPAEQHQDRAIKGGGLSSIIPGIAAFFVRPVITVERLKTTWQRVHLLTI